MPEPAEDMIIRNLIEALWSGCAAILIAWNFGQPR